VPSSRRLALELVAGLAIGAVLVVVIARRSDADAALVGALAYLAVLFAAAALRLTWPQYQRWRASVLAQRNMRVRIEIAAGGPPKPVGQHASFKGDSFIVRAVVENVGTGTMHNGIVNIVVPTTCSMDPIDPPPKGHYMSPLPSMNERITGGESPMPVYFTVARADFPPGDHVFHVRVRPDVGKGPWPVLVELSGTPMPAEGVRFARVEVSRT